MTRRSAVAGLAVALLITGCGGGHHAAAKPSPSSSGVAAAMRRLAQCIRAHGQPNFPDPVQQPDGDWTYPDTGGGKTKLPEACVSLKAQIRNEVNSPHPVSSADLAKLRQYAVCLRRSGIPDWPDPDTDGAFMLPARLRGMAKSTLMGQLKACEKYSPPRVKFKAPAGGGQ